ncbi:BQ5605_C032g11064 [Microbotryum silenes-dioicae]|uniref:BQ5605_C032g11064 protein n=1 Tax=Microbotryum silenes-dioicae TaxID=796604 RepID=A0A2X0N3D0_9BASI|nr:BQ5605_C032g11064 [Microbotryum silenes-dioicae]
MMALWRAIARFSARVQTNCNAQVAPGAQIHLLPKRRPIDLYVDSVPLADHILDDSLSPEESRELHLDARASYLIIRSLDPANKSLISNCSTANQRWDALRTYHLGERNSQIALISAQLSRMFYMGKSSISLEDHMIKIRDLNLKAKQLGYPRSNTEIAFQMLNSVTDPKWANTIEALSLTSDPTPTKIIARIKEREVTFALTNRIQGGTSLLLPNGPATVQTVAANSASDPKGSRKTGKKSRNRRKPTDTCTRCNGKGHWACDKECPGKRPESVASVNEGHNSKSGPPSRFVVGAHVAREMPTASSSRYSTALATARDPTSKLEWVGDSGAIRHLIGDRSLLRTFIRDPIAVQVADGSIQEVEGYGELSVTTKEGNIIDFKNVYCLPGAYLALISFFSLCDNGFELCMTDGGKTISVYLDNKFVCATERDTAYYFDFTIYNEPVAVVTRASAGAPLMWWHRVFGHLSHTILNMVSTKMIVYIKISDETIYDCETCIVANSRAAPFQHVSREPTEVLYRVFIDLGFVDVPDHKGRFVYLVIVDQLSSMKWTYPLTSKSAAEVLQVFCRFQAQAERVTGKTIKFVRSDNGGEFLNRSFEAEFTRLGITHEFTARYTPEQNGKAERANGSLFAMVRAMLKDAGLSGSYWTYALDMATFIANRMQHPRFKKKTIFEIFYGKKPSVGHLRPFGAIAFVLLPRQLRRKLDDHAKKGIFVGYSGEYNYMVLVNYTTSPRVLISCDVIFIDSLSEVPSAPADVDRDPEHFAVEEIFEYDLVPQLRDIRIDPAYLPVQDGPLAPAPRHAPDDPAQPQGPSDAAELVQDNVDDDDVIIIGEPVRAESPPPPEDELEDLVPQVPNDGYKYRAYNIGRSPGRFEDVNEENILPPGSRRVAARLAVGSSEAFSDPPELIASAMASVHAKEWQAATNKEIAKFISMGVLKVAALPPGARALGTKWVYTYKEDVSGVIIGWKARLVVQGFGQRKDIVYFDIFAPVSSISTILFLVAVSSALGLHLEQFDYESAFLNGVMTEDVYIKTPQGWPVPVSSGALKLLKSIYGTKQAPRQWNEALNSLMNSHGFTRSKVDACLYFKFSGKSFIFISIYVDDGLAASNDQNFLNSEIDAFHAVYKLKRLGPAKVFLGLEIARSEHYIFVHQSKYIRGLLETYVFTTTSKRGVQTPMEDKDQKTSSLPFDDITLYQSAVGALQYAAQRTRPDITKARIFRYLASSIDYGLLYVSSSSTTFEVYSNASWADDWENVKSVGAYAVILAGAVISWQSKQQSIVATSTTEAETLATSAAAKEAVGLRQLAAEFRIPQGSATLIHEDNEACIYIARNPAHRGRTKHWNVHHFYVRERIEVGDILLEYCPTDLNTADVLTKALPRAKFLKHRDGLGMVSLASLACGSVI